MLSQKLIAFIGQCTTSVYSNPYPQYSYEDKEFSKKEITHWPNIGGVCIVLEIRTSSLRGEYLKCITVETWGEHNWGNECPKVQKQRTRLINFLYREIN